MSSQLSAIAKRSIFRLLRAGFRVVPMREETRDRLRQSFLDRFNSLVPRPPIGRVGQAALGRRPKAVAVGPAIGHRSYIKEPLPEPSPVKLIAFYLPQFHAIDENNAWWGQGFTEWRNTTRALPQFEGHEQPRLPADLGFYDLRDTRVMHEQARLANEHGIGAFCFYFYWFAGKTLLESPLQQWLDDPSLAMPLCLCWANENWSRRWDGRSDQILIGQQHSADDDLAFIAHVSRYMRDERYVRVDGKPLLLVYRPGLLPDEAATADRWRRWCRNNGIGEIHLAYVQSFERPRPSSIGFDAAVEFPPNLSTPLNVAAQQTLLNPAYGGEVLDWRSIADEYSTRPSRDYTLYPGVNCGWDNEPRRTGQGRVLQYASPRRYRDWLRTTIASRLEGLPPTQRLVFINAWNEWAEGAVLEPDVRLGHAWLQATRAALTQPAEPRGPVRPCAVIHAWHMPAFEEILDSLRTHSAQWRLVITTSEEHEERVRTALRSRGLSAQLEIFENRGRDILPFLHVANRLLDEGEDVVLKVHTKKSLHRQDGDAWRRELLDRLLPAGQLSRVMDAFQSDARLGLLAPQGHLQPISHFWGLNEDNVRYLATRLGIEQPKMTSDTFASGSMFWIRLEALRPLLDAHLGVWEFETEAGQVDGTMAHAVERIFALTARSAGFNVRTVAGVCGLSADHKTGYQYAAKW